MKCILLYIFNKLCIGKKLYKCYKIFFLLKNLKTNNECYVTMLYVLTFCTNLKKLCCKH